MPSRPLLLAVALLTAVPVAASAGVPLPGRGALGSQPSAPASGVATSSLPVVDPTVVEARETEPVVLRGAAFGSWAALENVTAKAPLTDLTQCQAFDESCAHNHYESPEVDSSRAYSPSGTPTDRLTGWRWDARRHRFTQIPLQVDKMFVRYLDNSASGFAVYSGEDQHLSYEFDREGFRYTRSAPGDPCRAVPDSPTARDPIRGLDTNDEVVLMARDAGPQAPATARLPRGVLDMKRVTLRDPTNPGAPARYAYVMRSGDRGPRPAFTVANGYVHYQRDPNADTFVFSQSSYSNYGDAAVGSYCTPDGHLVLDPKTGAPAQGRRRPLDTATVTTPRYTYRYDGRWLMTSIRISADGGKTYGPNVVDRWKARAFQQDPSSKTPCCGYEDEDTNWGGSSTLMGERCGPVRCIRETWGADSGTNVVRREVFYRDEMRMKTFLRVHVIPPLDGIYAQWDFAAGRMNRFYNARHPDGVPIDGRNDTVFGNLDDPCNATYDPHQRSTADQAFRDAYQAAKLCAVSPYHQSVNVTDPTFADSANAALSWSETAGPYGTIVDRYQIDPAYVTAGGAAQSIVATPYYRDDACFDDGTGSDPGPRIDKRSSTEAQFAADGTRRRCWTPADGPTNGSDHFFQGDIGTHGVHLLFLADSDNARMTVPVDEIDFEQRQVFLPGQQPNVGERYGRAFEKPLLADVG